MLFTLAIVLLGALLGAFSLSGVSEWPFLWSCVVYLVSLVLLLGIERFWHGYTLPEIRQKPYLLRITSFAKGIVVFIYSAFAPEMVLIEVGEEVMHVLSPELEEYQMSPAAYSKKEQKRFSYRLFWLGALAGVFTVYFLVPLGLWFLTLLAFIYYIVAERAWNQVDQWTFKDPAFGKLVCTPHDLKDKRQWAVLAALFLGGMVAPVSAILWERKAVDRWVCRTFS